MASRTIHAVRSDAAAGTLLQSGIVGASSLLVLGDILSVDRLERYRSREVWESTRQLQWQILCERINDEVPDLTLVRPGRPLLGGWSELEKSDEVVLWAGVGVADQWFLAAAMYLAELSDLIASQIFIVQFREHSSTGAPIESVGELNPDEVSEGFDPEPLSSIQKVRLLRLWSAITASEPSDMVLLGHESDAGSDLIRRAVSDYVMRFPDSETGMSEWDFDLLKSASSGINPATRIVVDSIVRRRESLDQPGDTYLLWSVARMSDIDLSRPALSCSSDKLRHESCLVELTPFGREILNGKANFIAANGVNQWLGGTHLSSAENRVWYRRGDSLEL